MQSPFTYSPKIILAWGEAISGNAKIRDWLIKNGFPELGLFCFALRNKDEARDWLLNNGYPHLMAFINGVEGNPNALLWLEKNRHPELRKMAQAADNDEVAMEWVQESLSKELALLTIKIQFVKNRIDESNSDVHKFSKS